MEIIFSVVIEWNWYVEWKYFSVSYSCWMKYQSLNEIWMIFFHWITTIEFWNVWPTIITELTVLNLLSCIHYTLVMMADWSVNSCSIIIISIKPTIIIISSYNCGIGSTFFIILISIGNYCMHRVVHSSSIHYTEI